MKEKKKPATPEPLTALPDMIRIAVIVADTQFNVALVKDIANYAASRTSRAERYALVKVCAERQSVTRVTVKKL